MEATDLPENVRGLRRIEFERLVELGVFQDVRVELLDGQLVEMSPQGDAHSSITAFLAGMLSPRVPASMQVRQHSGFRAGDTSMPEPDISVVPLIRGYSHPSEAFLIVEVSDSSLHNDRTVKTKIYARAGIREYWIVNVQREQVEVFTNPETERYALSRVFGRGDTLTPTLIPGCVLDVSAILDC